MVDDRLESKPTKDEVKKLLGEACDALARYSKEVIPAFVCLFVCLCVRLVNFS